MIPFVNCANTERLHGTIGVSGESNEREPIGNQMEQRRKTAIFIILQDTIEDAKGSTFSIIR
jgi:hypothetical protein